VAGAFIDAETIQFRDLDEYFDLARESDVSFEHTSAWADFTSGGSARGRGIFLRGNFTRSPRTPHRAGFSVPFFAPEWLLNRFSIRAFNHLYFTRLTDRSVRRRVHYDPFFFPLDVVKSWNRLYGRRGLFQYQFVVPPGAARRVMAGVSEALDGSGVRPFLTILKSFGPRRSPGILSFPMEGLTVALDFPNLGEPTRRLFDRLDSLVADHGGRVYPAKDARMSAGMFRRFFPRLAEFSRFVDPKCSSGLWRRVMGVAHA
jgi:L-gulonolactone oxidase